MAARSVLKTRDDLSMVYTPGVARVCEAIVESPEDIVVFVAGADVPIPQNVFFPAWGFPPASVTVPVVGG